MFQIKPALLHILISILSLTLADYFFEGVYFENYLVVVITALILSLLNTFIKPILLFFTIPVTIMTLGLFLLIINGFILMLADELVEGFKLSSFWSAIGLSIWMGLMNMLIGGRAKVVVSKDSHPQ
jgi:putative membrane protein